MTAGFEFFQGVASENTAPKITCRKGGQLVLSAGTVAILGDDIEFVQLAYNRTKEIVGLRAATEDAKGRYRLRAQKNSENRLITGKRFFSHYGLTIEKARTYDAEEYTDGIIGFSLAEEPAEAEATTKQTGTSRRKTKAAA